MTGLGRHASEPRARSHGLSFSAVVGLVGLAAITALLLGGLAGGGNPPAPPTAPRSTVHDGIRLQLPSGWARADVAATPGFDRPLGLQNLDTGLRAVVELLPATSAALLPAAYLRAVERAPERPEVVRLATDREAWRYRFPGRDGSMTLIYAAPTTAGIATVACTSPIGERIPRECPALAAAVTVPGSLPLDPGTSAAFYSRLPSVVTDLDASRAKGVAELRAARRARGQAIAAAQLARAHKTAAAALAPLIGERSGAPAATLEALTATGTAYRALAGAARARLPRPYADARRGVTGAERDLRRAMTEAGAAASRASAPAAASRADGDPVTRTLGATDSALEAPAKVRPAATATGDADLTLVILALSGLIALSLVARSVVPALR